MLDAMEKKTYLQRLIPRVNWGTNCGRFTLLYTSMLILVIRRHVLYSLKDVEVSVRRLLGSIRIV